MRFEVLNLTTFMHVVYAQIVEECCFIYKGKYYILSSCYGKDRIYFVYFLPFASIHRVVAGLGGGGGGVCTLTAPVVKSLHLTSQDRHKASIYWMIRRGASLRNLPFVYTNHSSYAVQLQFLIMEMIGRNNQHQMQLTGNDRFQRFIFLSYPIQHETLAFILLAKKGRKKIHKINKRHMKTNRNGYRGK